MQVLDSKLQEYAKQQQQQQVVAATATGDYQFNFNRNPLTILKLGYFNKSKLTIENSAYLFL